MNISPKRIYKRHISTLKEIQHHQPFREIQIKATMKYHYTPVRKAKIKNVTTSNIGRDVEKLDHSYIAGGRVKQYSGKQVVSFL